MVWEEEEVTDGRADKGRHPISLTSPLASLGRDNSLKPSNFILISEEKCPIKEILMKFQKPSNLLQIKNSN